MSRRLLIWIAAILALGAIARGALPYALRPLLERQVSAALGARFALTNVDLWLVRGRVAVDGVSLAAGPESSPPAVELARGLVDIAWLPLISGRVLVENLELAEPQVRLDLREDGTLALADWPIVEEVAPAVEAAVEEPVAALHLVLARVKLQGAGIELREVGADAYRTLRGRLDDLEIQGIELTRETGASGAPRWRLTRAELAGGNLAIGGDERERLTSDLEATILGLGSGPEEAGQIELALRSEGGRIDLTAAVRPAPLSVDATLRIESWSLAPWWKAIAPDQAEVLDRATVDAEIELRLEPSEAEGSSSGEPGTGAPAGRASASGRVAVRDLAATIPGARPVEVEWASGELELRALRAPLAPGPVEVEVASLRFSEPRVEAVIALENGSNGGSGSPTETEGGDAASREPGYSVEAKADRIAIEQGAVEIRDADLPPDSATRLSRIELDARDVAWPGPRAASIALRAAGHGGRPIRVDGVIDPVATRLDVEIDRLSLVRLDPYIRRASSYTVKNGDLSLTSRIEQAADQYAVRNRVVLHRLAIDVEGDRSVFQQQFGVPLDLAMALLRDASGDIALDVPLEVGGEGAVVGLQSAIGSGLRQALKGALSAPLKLLKSVVPSGVRGLEGAALEPVAFEPASAEVGGDARARLEEVASLVIGHPELRVGLDAVTGSIDRAALEQAGDPDMDATRLGTLRLDHVSESLVAAGVELEQIRVSPTRSEREGAGRVELMLGLP